jgi:hypothetical protein
MDVKSRIQQHMHESNLEMLNTHTHPLLKCAAGGDRQVQSPWLAESQVDCTPVLMNKYAALLVDLSASTQFVARETQGTTAARPQSEIHRGCPANIRQAPASGKFWRQSSVGLVAWRTIADQSRSSTLFVIFRLSLSAEGSSWLPSSCVSHFHDCAHWMFISEMNFMRCESSLIVLFLINCHDNIQQRLLYRPFHPFQRATVSLTHFRSCISQYTCPHQVPHDDKRRRDYKIFRWCRRPVRRPCLIKR